MKTSVLFLTALLITSISYAKVWTVSNNPNSPGQFYNIQTAIDSSIVQDGDTLYITGSKTNYGDFILNKSLTLIGTGHHTEKDFAFTTMVRDVTLEEKKDAYGTLTNSANNSSIIGIKISNITDSYGSGNIFVSKSHITGEGIFLHSNSSHWRIHKNYMTYIYGRISINDANNLFINNNILKNIERSDKSSVIITNNLFINSNPFSYISYATIINNIFYGSEDPYITPSDAEYCIMNNNISTSMDLPYGTNTGLNNIKLSNVGFINVPAGDYEFDWGYNYDLNKTSVALNAGSDGNHIGPFSGDEPLSTTGEPNIPKIQQLNILNPTLAKTDKLKVQVKANVGK